ncbi:MAG: hypothetical protein K1X95_15440 [Acidimicrobiia bacterium]|nr:hypothetical protein [Acidimicrobiia bacterium]
MPSSETSTRFDPDSVVAELSAAVREHTASGECRLAAMACAHLGDTYATAYGNLTAARAWFARARRLVDAEPPCIEQGWVAVAAMGCDVDDPDELLAAAELALERARRFGDVNLETKALADGGLAHVQAGRLGEGMAMLDEAMALACGPADDTGVAAKSVCSFFTACYFASDYDRARIWADLLRAQGVIGTGAPGPVYLSSHCDSVHATMLMELGRWSEAEAVLTAAKARFEAAMPVPSWHPDIALADLRIRQGRLADAEALLAGKDQFMQALLPSARLHLARGDHALAEAIAHRGLRALGSDRLRAGELLTLVVQSTLGRGAVDEAVTAAERLAVLVADVDVGPLEARAVVALAQVRAAQGHLDDAIARLESGIDHLGTDVAPWLGAGMLLELARLRDEASDPDGASVDAARAATILSTLDVTVAPRDAEFVARMGGPRAGPQRTEAVLERDGDWWTVSWGGTQARLKGTKGLRYLGELVARPGGERHVFDLVDRVEGVAVDGIDRRGLGDAGEVLDAQARDAYRHRVEELRSAADDAIAEGRLDAAESAQHEIDALMGQLAEAFGLGGRSRRSASAAERARLNVTRALRAATSRIEDALPEAGDTLDRRLRTGIYCAYEPDPADTIVWRRG